MSAQDLSSAELVTATGHFVSGDFATWLRGNDMGARFAVEIDRLRPIVASAPSDSSEVGRLTVLLEEEDSDHDSGVRFGVGYLQTYAEHHHDEEVRADASAGMAAVFPDGVALVNRSCEEEAGRTEARARALTPELRARLARFRMVESDGGPATFVEWIDDVLQVSSRRLGELLDQRERLALDPDAPTPADLLRAKRELITVVTQAFASFAIVERQLSEADLENLREARGVWDAAVEKATIRGDARRRNRKSKKPVPPVS